MLIEYTFLICIKFYWFNIDTCHLAWAAKGYFFCDSQNLTSFIHVNKWIKIFKLNNNRVQWNSDEMNASVFFGALEKRKKI